MFVTVLYVAIIDIKEKGTRAWKKKKLITNFKSQHTHSRKNPKMALSAALFDSVLNDYIVHCSTV